MVVKNVQTGEIITDLNKKGVEWSKPLQSISITRPFVQISSKTFKIYYCKDRRCKVEMKTIRELINSKDETIQLIKKQDYILK